jgi:hypothetical protein
MASQSHSTSRAARRKTRRLVVYDDVVGVLKDHDAQCTHEVRHGITFAECDIVKVILDGFGDGVAEALIKDHGFELAEESGNAVLWRKVY